MFQFVDDVKMYCSTRTPVDSEVRQNGVDEINLSYQVNFKSLYPAKTNVVFLSR